MMSPALAESGAAMAAVALILFAVASFLTGTAVANGAIVRSAVTPALEAFRGSSPKSRSELADATVVFAVVLSVVAVFVDRAPLAGLVALILWHARPTVRRITREERPLLAMTGQFSTDLVVGLYAPVVLAQVLLGNLVLAASLGAVLISLCWPPGGAGRSVGPWRPAWVAS